MEILDARDDNCFAVDEQLLDFNFDDETPVFKGPSSPESSKPAAFARQPFMVSVPEFVEEEDLEWLSNKESFPALETCFGILSDNPELLLKHHSSPISVLENTTTSSITITNTNSSGSGGGIDNCCSALNFPATHPVRARTKRRKRRAGFGEMSIQHCLWRSQIITKSNQESSLPLRPARSTKSIGRRCLHCQSDKTPQWRAGPMGPKTLCNACGVRYKSGRLLPEYRPASSPTFSSILHSNSHRKVVEMRRQKQQMIAGECTAAPTVK